MKKFFKRFIFLYTDNRVPMASAALSYYLTMTFFPLIICLYTLLGNNYDAALEALKAVDKVLPESVYNFILRFMDYVQNNYSVVMMLLAVSVIILTASAAFRSMQNTIGRMQGARRYEGYAFFVGSMILALLFTVTVWLGIVAIFTGEVLVNWLNSLTSVDISSSWMYLRFIILFAVALIIIVLIFEICKRKEDHYPTFCGAFIATGGLVGISYLFSLIINNSIKYPTVYASLASIILLMFWLYCCCQVIYIGATVNVTLRDMKESKNSFSSENAI